MNTSTIANLNVMAMGQLIRNLQKQAENERREELTEQLEEKGSRKRFKMTIRNSRTNKANRFEMAEIES